MYAIDAPADIFHALGSMKEFESGLFNIAPNIWPFIKMVPPYWIRGLLQWE
jgi:hypothetical protein